MDVKRLYLCGCLISPSLSVVPSCLLPDQAASPHQGPTLSHRLFLAVTRILKGLLRSGLPMGPMVLLTVRGRKSGEPRTTPVDVFERNGRSFLDSTHRQESSNWVRNLRTTGEGVSAEVAAADPSLLWNCLQRPARRWLLFVCVD